MYGIGRSQLITISHRPHSQVGSLLMRYHMPGVAECAAALQQALSEVPQKTLLFRSSSTDLWESSCYACTLNSVICGKTVVALLKGSGNMHSH